jgi:hypothetical protein
VNWLADKVVEGLPSLPPELKPPMEASDELHEMITPQDVSSNMTAKEEWIPASKAVDRAEQSGHPITVTWLTRDAAKHGIRIRPSQQRGRHHKEVEWNSLAGYLLKRVRPEKESSEEEVAIRFREAQLRKRKARFLD